MWIEVVSELMNKGKPLMTKAQENENISNCSVMWKMGECCPLNYGCNQSSEMPFCIGICAPASGLPFSFAYTANSSIGEIVVLLGVWDPVTCLSPFLLAFFSLFFISTLPHTPSFLLVCLSHFLLSSLSTHWWFIKTYSPLMISYGVVLKSYMSFPYAF